MAISASTSYNPASLSAEEFISHEEILETMDDILSTGCQRLTLGQYLQPTVDHLPVKAYITPEKFAEYKRIALEKGFKHVVSGPLVRSSYHAAEGI